MRILVIFPAFGFKKEHAALRTENLMNKKSPDTELDVTTIKSGTAYLGTNFDNSFAAPEILRCIIENHDEYDGFVVHAFVDPAVEAARELTHKPVLGLVESSMCLATLTGSRFSVLTPLRDESKGWIFRRARTLGYEKNLVSVRSFNIPVVNVCSDPIRDKNAFLVQARRSIAEDQVDTIIAGCGGYSVYADELTQELGIPVINPGASALVLVEAQVRLGLTHSRLAYAPIEAKQRLIERLEYNEGSK